MRAQAKRMRQILIKKKVTAADTVANAPVQHRLRGECAINVKIREYNARIRAGGGALHHFDRANNEKWDKDEWPCNEQSGERRGERRRLAKKGVGVAVGREWR